MKSHSCSKEHLETSMLDICVGDNTENVNNPWQANTEA